MIGRLGVGRSPRLGSRIGFLLGMKNEWLACRLWSQAFLCFLGINFQAKVVFAGPNPRWADFRRFLVNFAADVNFGALMPAIGLL